jgi:hypothetical protein
VNYSSTQHFWTLLSSDLSSGFHKTETTQVHLSSFALTPGLQEPDTFVRSAAARVATNGVAAWPRFRVGSELVGSPVHDSISSALKRESGHRGGRGLGKRERNHAHCFPPFFALLHTCDCIFAWRGQARRLLCPSPASVVPLIAFIYRSRHPVVAAQSASPPTIRAPLGETWVLALAGAGRLRQFHTGRARMDFWITV